MVATPPALDSNTLIPTSAELETLREVGRIAAKARNWAAETIRPGYLLRDLQEGMEMIIRDAGAFPPFPAQTSRNSVGAHYCSSPSDKSEFEENDLVKIDVGAHIDGLIVDTGVSADLSEDERWKEMIGAASDALDAAICMCSPNVDVEDIGQRVEEVINAAGFRPILNLTGHGLGRYTLHDKPQIPNAPIGLKGISKRGRSLRSSHLLLLVRATLRTKAGPKSSCSKEVQNPRIKSTRKRLRRSNHGGVYRSQGAISPTCPKSRSKER